MFNNAQDTSITGGSFSITTNVNTENTTSLDVFYRRVAPNAILNAGGRADEVRCHPGTREEVIGRIEKWGDAHGEPTAPIFWLSGPAGAGKSAIVQTVAERCDQRKIPHANFFFFRGDSSRSHASPLLATLLHQVILLYPSLQDNVTTILSTNRFIFDSALETQLSDLIVAPLRTIQLSSSDYRPLVLLIDGLDECDSESKRSQQQILRAFDQVLAGQPCPLRLLVASRDESQIRAAFNRMSSPCLQLYLDEQYFPESDIRLFVNDQFEQVRKTHPLAHTLHSDTWPSVDDVNYIVEKSSGQFIYAATVMRFISDSSASPMVSLERVQGAAQLATKSPFSHLDAIYTYILSQAEDQEALKDILHAQVFITKSARLVPRKPLQAKSGIQFSELLKLFDQKYTEPVVISCLADLTPISRYDDESDKLLFYHASFPDYLLDQSRSREYFVDLAAFSYKIIPAVWNLVEKQEYQEKWLEPGLFGLSQLQKAPPGFMKMLAATKNVWSGPRFSPSQSPFFQTIYNLCTCDDDIINFRCVFRQWIQNWQNSNFTLISLDEIEKIPFSHRYFQMICADRYWAVAPDAKTAAALSPETDFDRHELAVWLNDLLHRIHKERYLHNTEHYKQLLYAWISWAVGHDIPCDGLHNLPEAQQYIQRSMDEKRAAPDSVGGCRK